MAVVGGISVHVYTGQKLSFKTDSYAEDICYEVARHIKVGDETLSNRDFSLFQLATKDMETWLNPGRKITRCMELVFRMRFLIKRDKGCFPLGKVAQEYYFKQCQNDYRKSGWNTFKDEEILGMAVMDMARAMIEDRIPQEQVMKTYSKFLPENLPTRYLWPHNRQILKKRLKDGLKDCGQRQWQPIELKIKYIEQFEGKSENFGKEIYNTKGIKKEVVEVSGDNGIVIKESEHDDKIHFDFCDVTDVVIFPMSKPESDLVGCEHNIGLVKLEINRRKGDTLTLQMCDQDQAVSLVSLLDGYYRLLVDNYHYLCKDCAPPMQMKLAEAKCHGPISRSQADEKIHSVGLVDGTFLIRQNPDPTKLGGFCLMLCYDGKINNYPVDANRGTEVSFPDEPNKFQTIRQFIDAYRKPNQCLQVPLKLCIPPSTKEKSLLLKRAGGGPDIPSSPKQVYRQDNADSGVWIQEDSLQFNEADLLGKGAFTNVYKGTYISKSPGENEQSTTAVAIKQLSNSDNEKKFEKIFFQTADKILFLKNPHVVAIIGVRKFVLVMEFLQFGSLNVYLNEHAEDMESSDLLKAVIQVAQALAYLEEKSVVHGSVCARNVLVASEPSTFRVKLADPLFGNIYYALKTGHEARLKRVPWTPPEHLVCRVRANADLDKFAFAVFCWEVFRLGREPFREHRSEDIRKLYLEGKRPQLKGIPGPFTKIMSLCWHQDPIERPPFKSILRDFRMIIPENLTTEGNPGDWARSISESFMFEPEMQNGANGADSGVVDVAANVTALNSDEISSIDESTLMDQPHPVQPAGSISEDDFADILDPVDIESDSLALIEIIGSGHYGEVWKGILKRYPNIPEKNEDVAVKKLPKPVALSRKYTEDFMREIRQTASLDCERVVKVKGICRDNVLGLMMVMEYLPKGALSSHLKNHKNLPLKTLCNYSLQVAEGMNYLASKRVVHRDLAARNILVASSHSVKISDFGLARYMTGGDKSYYRQKSDQENPILWHAPESIQHKKYDSKGDVWGYGVLLWEIFTYGDRPRYFYGTTEVKFEELFYKLMQGLRLRKPNRCPDSVYEVMKGCWILKAEDRPTFSELEQDFKSVIDKMDQHDT